MPNRLWLERVRALLLRRGLPRDYAARLVEELGDHAADLEADGADIGERLGTPEAVAGAAVAAYRAGSFAGRRPVLVFVVGPLLLAHAAWWLNLVLGVCLVDAIGGAYDPVSLAVAHGLVVLTRFLPPGVALGGLWWAYRRSGRPRAWFAAGGLLVAALAGWYHIDFTGPTAAAGPDATAEFDLFASWWQAVQFAVPLAAGGLLLRRLVPQAPGGTPVVGDG